MQERIPQVFLDTLDYLEELDTNSEYWFDTAECMVDDLLEYCHGFLPFVQKDLVLHHLSEIKKFLSEGIHSVPAHQM